MATVFDEIKNWLNDITQGFKWSPSNVRAHSGVDIGLKYGTPVYAIHSGTINYSGVKAWGGQISEVETAYGQPVTDSYLHLSQELVRSGQQVQAGQLIGYSGSPPTRQYGTGPHLHFEETFGSQAPYVTASNPWRPTAQSYPLNPIPLLQQTASVGGGNPLDPITIMQNLLPGVIQAQQTITDIPSGLGNLASQIQQFPQNVVNSIGQNIKQQTGITSVPDFLWRVGLTLLGVGIIFFAILAFVFDMLDKSNVEVAGTRA